MKFSLIVLLAIAFSQGSGAETIPELVQEFSSIVQERVAEVGQLIGGIGKSIGQTYGEIQNNIDQAAQNLTKEIADIANVVNASLARADALEKNIDVCVSDIESSVSSLDLDVLKTCKVSENLINAQKLITEVVRLPRQLGALIPRCLSGMLKDVVTIRSCLSQGLQAVDDTVNDVDARAKALIDGALDAASKCIEGALENVNNSICIIEDSLEKCVEDILSS